MKSLQASTLITILLPISTFAQNIPWTYHYGSKSISGLGNERCHQELLHQNEQFSFDARPAQPTPSPQWGSQECSLHTTLSKEWERRDDICSKEKDKKKKETCFDRLEVDKKAEKQKVDDCQKKRERACGAMTDAKARENCFSQLDSERKGGVPVQQPQQQKPQTKCCLRLYSENDCKTKVFEACSTGGLNAKGDAPSWNVVCV